MIPPFLRSHVLNILNAYTGAFPLSDHLKKYFRQHPEAGSRDRKLVSAAVYGYFRCAKGIGFAPGSQPDPLAVAAAALDIIDGKEFASDSGFSFDPELLFSGDFLFSAGITRQAWLNAMLRQPDLFIRVRRDGAKLKDLLKARGLSFAEIDSCCLSLQNGANVEPVLPASAYVVQDASSQKTGSFFKPVKGEKWWDTCAGAGGKSLMVADAQPGVSLTVTDCRDTILYNLTERFKKYGLPIPFSICLDMTDSAEVQKMMGARRYDHIICDVPCSGSGTWARTPENLYFFDPAAIEDFHELQTKIATNAANYLLPGGTLFYITCSVFKRENEDVVDRICQSTGVVVKESLLINGIDAKADSMFIAVLSK